MNWTWPRPELDLPEGLQWTGVINRILDDLVFILEGVADVIHRIDQLTAHEIEGRAPVKQRVMERIGQNLGGPGSTGLHVVEKEQVHRAEDDASHAEHEPGDPDIVQVATEVGRWFDQPADGWCEPQHQRTQTPEGHQKHLASQVVADLDLFFVLVRGVIDLIIPLRLKEKVA